MTDTKTKSSLRRVARITGIMAAAGLALVLALVLALLLSPTRNRILESALSFAERSLPGKLTIERAKWPALGTIDLDGALWVDTPDTLLAAKHMTLSVELLPLLRGDVHVTELVIRELAVSTGAITRRFASDGATGDETKPRGRGWPRSGALPRVPSVAADRLTVTGRSIEVGGVEFTNIDLAGAFDLRHGATPAVTVERLAFAERGGRGKLDSLRLDVDLESGVLTGGGSGAVSPGTPVHFRLTNGPGDAFALRLSREPGAEPPKDVGVAVEGRLRREGFDVRALDIRALVRTPSTTDLQRYPTIAARLEALPELEGLVVAAHGTVDIRPAFALTLECNIEPNGWLRGGRVSIDYRDGTAAFDGVELAVDGAAIRANGRIDAGAVEAEASIEVTGTGWRRMWLPDADIPDDLTGKVAVSLELPKDASLLSARVEGSGHAGGIDVDRLLAWGEVALSARDPSSISVIADAFDTSVGVAGTIERGDGLVLRVTPIVVSERSLDPAALPAKRTSELHYDADTGALRASDVRLTGVFGDVRLSAELDSTRRGRYRVTGLWKAVPTALASRLRAVPDSVLVTLSNDAPFTVELAGRLDLGSSMRVTTEGLFRLPGPRAFAGLLPESVEVGDMGPIEGRVRGRARLEPTREVVVNVDLGATSWIDYASIAVAVSGDTTRLDTTVIALEGARIVLAGTLVGDEPDVTARIELSDGRLLKRWSAAAPDVTMLADARLRGTLGSPAVTATVSGRVDGDGYSMPELVAELGYDSTHAVAAVDLPGGIAAKNISLAQLSVVYQTVEAGAIVPADVSVDAVGDGIALESAIRLDVGDDVSARVDSIVLAINGEELRSRRPFRVVLDASTETITLDDVELSGSMGTFRAAGFARRDSSDLRCTMAIALGQSPPRALHFPNVAWPRRIEADIAARGRDHFEARIVVPDLALLGRRPALEMNAAADSGRVRTDFTVADDKTTIFAGRADLPATVVVYPPRFLFYDGPVTVHADMDEFPFRVAARGGEHQGQVDGRMRISGTSAAPVGSLSVDVGFPEWPSISQYRLLVNARLTPREATPGGASPDPSASADTASGSRPGVTRIDGSIKVRKGDQQMLSAILDYPVHLSMIDGVFAPAVGEHARLDLESTRFPLSDLDALLPVDLTMKGTSSIALKAEGPLGEVQIDGKLTTSDLTLERANKGSLVASGELTFGGAALTPELRGGIDVTRGVIIMPETERELHPVEGDAILRMQPHHPAPVDTTRDRPEVLTVPTGDLDVSLRIPGAVWIRGHGLDVELAGEVRAKQVEDHVTVTGGLRAVRGTLDLLGHKFQLDRGTVTFEGRDEINPSLDVHLSSRIGATTVRVLFSGTAKKPEMTLASDPPLEESDIMSVIVFGKPRNELTDDQSGLLTARAATIAASIGAAELQERLGRQMGIDVITVRDTGRGSEENDVAVSVGKYISSNLLLSYVQPLDRQNDFFLSLQYFLGGNFSVETLYGKRGQSGMGVGWTTDY